MNTTSYYSSIISSNNNNAGPLAKKNDTTDNTKAWRRDERILLASRTEEPSWRKKTEPNKHKHKHDFMGITGLQESKHSVHLNGGTKPTSKSRPDVNIQSKHSAYLNGGTTPPIKSRFSECHSKSEKEKEAPLNIPFPKDKNWRVPIRQERDSSSASGWLSQMFPAANATTSTTTKATTAIADRHPTRAIATTRVPTTNGNINNRSNQTFKPKKRLMLSRPKTRRLIASILDGRTTRSEAENEAAKAQGSNAAWANGKLNLTTPPEEQKDSPSPSATYKQSFKERLDEYYALSDPPPVPAPAHFGPALLVKRDSKLLSRSSSLSSSLSSGPAEKKKGSAPTTTNTTTPNAVTPVQHQHQPKQTATTSTKLKPTMTRPATTTIMPDKINPLAMHMARRNSSIPLVIVIMKQQPSSFTKSSSTATTSAATSPTTTMKSSSTTTISSSQFSSSRDLNDACHDLDDKDEDGPQIMKSFYSSPSRKYFQKQDEDQDGRPKAATTTDVSPSATPTSTLASKVNRELVFSQSEDRDDGLSTHPSPKSNQNDGVRASIVPLSIKGNQNKNDDDEDDDDDNDSASSALTDADYGVLDEYSFAPSDYTPETFGSATI